MENDSNILEESEIEVEKNYGIEEEIEESIETTDVTLALFKCEDCNFESKRKVGLTIHKKKKHNSIPQLDGFEEINSSKETQTDFKCDQCVFVAENNDMLREHNNSYHKRFNCWECEYNTTHKSLMRLHQRECEWLMCQRKCCQNNV